MQIITVSTAYRGESGQAIDQSTNFALHWGNHPETYQLDGLSQQERSRSPSQRSKILQGLAPSLACPTGQTPTTFHGRGNGTSRPSLQLRNHLGARRPSVARPGPVRPRVRGEINVAALRTRARLRQGQRTRQTCEQFASNSPPNAQLAVDLLAKELASLAEQASSSLPPWQFCALEAIAPVFRHPLHVNARLPHINLPVGDEKDAEISMEAMIDTGAGLNLGCCQYHAEAYRFRLKIVEQYKEIDNVSNMEKFRMGGIKRSDSGIECTAVITYKLPYVHNRAPVRLTKAQSDAGVAANTILSSRFIKNNKCAILFEQDVLVSNVLVHWRAFLSQ